MLPLVEELREVRDKAGTQRAKQQEIPTLAKKSIEIMGPKYGHNYVVFLIRVMKFRANQNRSEAPSQAQAPKCYCTKKKDKKDTLLPF
jgi:hypothetical protein